MRALIATFVFGCTALITPLALAQDAPPEPEVRTAGQEQSAAEERAAQFVGVTGPEAESIPGGALLLAAYAVVWVLIFLFLLRMRGLQRQTAEELERLSAEIKASGGR
ncbi:MAG: CcmD family protein [Polyangiales bacterium]|jgi:CcmD family protein